MQDKGISRTRQRCKTFSGRNTKKCKTKEINVQDQRKETMQNKVQGKAQD